jgi:hypothetical protein
MKTIRILMAIGFSIALSAPFAVGADTDSASVWTLADSTMGAGGIAVYESEGSAVTISFPAQSQPPMPLLCDLLIGGTDPANVFTGDLLGAGYSGIRFKIAGNGSKPESISLVIHQKDGRYTREWVNTRVGVSETPGEWMITLIPLAREPDWTTGFISKMSKDELWAYDLAAVQTMILRIVPSGTAAQSYSISDFQLVGPGVISQAANLTPLQAYFGVSSVSEMTAEMYALDSDGDGMSDYNEILAGMDPYNAASVFAANMSKGLGKNTVVWSGVLGKRYGIMRSTDLSKGFELIASAITCNATGLMQYDDYNPVADAPNFYKIISY